MISIAEKAQEALGDVVTPMEVAVMGCVVNGPGEAKGADRNSGRSTEGHLFVRGQVVKVVPEGEMVEALVEWGQKIASEGVDVALASADESAAAEAEADRQALLEIQGEDVNQAEAVVQTIRKR